MNNVEERMPAQLTEIYDGLFQQVTWLHSKWELFCQLYASSEENVRLLNDSAPFFFAILQDMLVDDVLLTISRLTDRPQISRRDNLSLAKIASLIDEATYPELSINVNTLLDDVKQHCGFARELRNRRIAHSDLVSRIRVENNSLPSVTKKRIEEALRSIRAVMNEIEQYFAETTVMYEMPIVRDDGNTLLRCLQDAKTYRLRQRASWRRKYGIEGDE